MTNGILQPAKISAENIIRPSFDELSADQREAYETLKKQRQEQREEEIKALKEKQEEEDLQAYLASFKVDRQGTGTSQGEIKLPPLLGNSAGSSVSNSLFTPEQVAEIQSHVNFGNEKMYNVLLERDTAKKNTPPPKSSVPHMQIGRAHV